MRELYEQALLSIVTTGPEWETMSSEEKLALTAVCSLVAQLISEPAGHEAIWKRLASYSNLMQENSRG